jgi:hypothetical protein
MTYPPLTLKRWTRAEYDRLVGLGVFDADPIELVGGQLIVAEPQSAYHASAIRTVDQDYWIVNLVDRVLEVYRDPGPDAAAVYGWGYRSITTLVPPALVTPLAFPSAQVAVADLLP